MEQKKDVAIAKKISWGSIAGGIITVVSTSLVLSILGTALGLTIVDPLSDDPDNGASKTLLFWTGASIIASLAAGAFVAGRLATNDGVIHGFLVWATSLIVTVVIGIMLVSSAVKATGNVLGSLASVSGSLVSGAGSIANTGLQEASNLGAKLFESLDIDTSLEPQKLQSNVVEALRKSKIPSLQPEFVQQQLNGAKSDINSALKTLATRPNDVDVTIQNIVDKLQERAATVTKDIDRSTLTDALSNNTDMNQHEINQAVDNIIAAKKEINNIISQRFDDINEKIEQLKDKYEELKEKALRQAANAATSLAKSAFLAFVLLILGATTSCLTGYLGSRTSRTNHQI
ncbi:CAP-Gly protein [Serratia nevei]|uniref:CAP-Gly protein n=1 Tax=Serratia nevei TaxID=2703794 RepID=UPI003FA7D092